MFNPNFHFPMQNQYMNGFNIEEELVKPYREKIKKLEEEISKKDLEITQLKFKLFKLKNNTNNNQIILNNNINQMNNQMSNQMNSQMGNLQMNNQMSNQMNNQIGNLQMNNFNFMNQMQNIQMFNQNNNNIFNQMNQMGNPMFGQMNNINNSTFEGLNQNNILDTQAIDEEEIEYLTVIFKINESQILLQCKSNDKISSIIDKFCCKAYIKKEDYKFIFNGKDITHMNRTIKDFNISNNCTIFVDKKDSHNINNNKIMINNQQEAPKETNSPKINIFFQTQSGIKICIGANINDKFNKIAAEFANKFGIPNKALKYLSFLYNNGKIDVNDIRNVGEIFPNTGNLVHITVLNSQAIIGA